MAQELALGIDLGTHQTRVALIQGDRAVVVPDRFGETLHASVVSFRPDNTVLVGNEARVLLATSPENTVYGTKRLLGRYFFSDEVKRARATVPFKLVEGPGGLVEVAVGSHQYGVAQITSLLLREMKALAQLHLGQAVDRVVVTVPASFHEQQRRGLEEAVTLAGLTPLDVLEESTAAALAHGLTGQAQRLCIYEMGGSACTVTIVEVNAQGCHVLSSARDPHLGGEDLDDRLVTWLAESFAKETGVDLTAQPVALMRLRAAAEHAKNTFSTADVAQVSIPLIHADMNGKALDLERNVTRRQFFPLVMDVMQRSFKLVDEALRTAQLTAASVEHVILVGAPTRLPLIHNGLQHYFKKAPSSVVDPNLVVAMGAARHAEMMMRGAAPLIVPRNTGPARSVEEMDPPPRVTLRLFQQDAAGGGAVLQGEMEARTAGKTAEGALRVDLVVATDGHAGAHVVGGPSMGGHAAATPEQMAQWEKLLGEVKGLRPQAFMEELAQVRMVQQEVVNAAAGLDGKLATVRKAAEGLEARRAELQLTEAQLNETKQLRKLAHELGGQVAASGTVRKELAEEGLRARGLLEDLKTTAERHGGALRDVADRLAALERGSRELAGHVQGNQELVVNLSRTLEARAQDLGTVGSKVTDVLAQLEDLHIRHDELRDKEPVLEAVQSRLVQVEVLARRSTQQLEDVQRLESQVRELAGALTRADAVRAGVQQAQEEAQAAQHSLQLLVQRVASTVEEVQQARTAVDGVASEVHALQEAQQRLLGIGTVMEDVRARMEQVGAARQSVDNVAQRLVALEALSQDVLGREGALLDRKAAVEGLRDRVERADVQLAALAGSLTSLGSEQERLYRALDDVQKLQKELDEARARFQAAVKDQEALDAQVTRLEALSHQADDAEAATRENLARMEKLHDELGKAGTVRQQLVEELAETRARQDQVAVQAREATEQLSGLERTLKTLEERRKALATSESRLANASEQIHGFETSVDAVDSRVAALEKRAAALEDMRALLREMQEKHADARARVDEWRAQEDTLKAFQARVDEAVTAARELDGRMKGVADKKRDVEGVAENAKLITEMMADVEEKLLWLNEQHATVELATDKVRELEVAVKDADNAMQALKQERSLAQRIDQAIRQLREKKEE